MTIDNVIEREIEVNATNRRGPINVAANDNQRYPATAVIMEAVKKRFDSYNPPHQPSEQAWEGLTAIARTIEDMDRGAAQQHYYVSPLPVGIGKTTVIEEAIRYYLEHEPNVGIVYFANRIDQIERVAKELFPDQFFKAEGEDRAVVEHKRFAINVGLKNAHLNLYGRCRLVNGKQGSPARWAPEHQGAQVMFTTQAKLHAIVAKSKYCGDLQHFWKYRTGETVIDRDEGGNERVVPMLRPRRIHIWDESIAPAAPIKIKVAELENAADTQERMCKPVIATFLRDTAQKIKDAARANLGYVALPQWGTVPAEVWNSDFPDDGAIGKVLRIVAGQLSGKEWPWVHLFKDLKRGKSDVVMHYHEILPRNITPVIILDAGHQHRYVYQVMRHATGSVTVLPNAVKTYKNLNIHYCDARAGQKVYEGTGEAETEARDHLIELAAEAAREARGEDVLVVHRQRCAIDFPEAVRTRVKAEGGDPNRLHFLTWGRHNATNDFHGVKHCIVLGLLQYDNEDNAALLRAYGLEDPMRPSDPRDIELARIGETMAHLFQAAGRSAVRSMQDGDCPPGCTLRVVFSGHDFQLWKQMFGVLFPGAPVHRWRADDTRQRFIEVGLRLGTFTRADMEEAGFSRRHAQRLMGDRAVHAAWEASGFEPVVSAVGRDHQTRIELRAPSPVRVKLIFTDDGARRGAVPAGELNRASVVGTRLSGAGRVSRVPAIAA